MRRPVALVSTLVLALGLPTVAAAQATWLVGAGGYTTIDAALAGAAPGDVVLVQPGTYGSFHSTIGVTVRAAANGAVFVLGSSTASVPAGQELRLVDLDLDPLFVNGGRVGLDRCRVLPGVNPLGAPLTLVNAHAVLVDCAIGGPAAPYLGFGVFAGLVATSSTVTAIGSTFRGLDRGGLTGTTPGSPAVHLASSTLQGSGLVLQGGDGVSSSAATPGPALVGGPAWLADSTLRGGRAMDLPGTPIWTCPAAGATGRLARCTLLPAACASGMALGGPVLGARRVLVPASAGQLQIELQGEPFDAIGLWLSPTLGVAGFPELAQPVSLDLSRAQPVGVLFADAAGLAGATWTLPPGFGNAALWLQAVGAGPLPMAVSPVVGGVLR